MLKLIKYIGLFILLLTNAYTSCNKKSVPSLLTADVTDIKNTSVVVEGIITDKGSGVIMTKGVCWSTDPDPTVADKILISSTETLTFEITIEGLEVNTLYYVRTYATNEAGTGYGNQAMFTANQPESWMMMPDFELPSGGISLISESR